MAGAAPSRAWSKQLAGREMMQFVFTKVPLHAM